MIASGKKEQSSEQEKPTRLPDRGPLQPLQVDSPPVSVVRCPPPNPLTTDHGPRTGWYSIFLVLGDAVDPLLTVVAEVVGQPVLHQEGVLAAVLVEAAQHTDGLEGLGAEKELGGQV